MSITTAIVDDDREFCDHVQQEIRAWGAQKDVDLSVSSLHSASELSAACTERCPFDIAFIDMDLGNAPDEGLSIAHNLHERGESVLVVFLTHSSDFLEAGYRVRAFRYLCKPLSHEALYECLDAAKQELSEGNSILRLKSRERIVNIPFAKIMSLSVNGKFITVSTLDGVYRHRAQLKEMCQKLPKQFARCNRWDIVNIDHISSLGTEGILMDNGDHFQVGRKYRMELVNKFMKRPYT